MTATLKLILLIDDDSDEHSLFKSALENYNSNISCITAFNCEQGYEIGKNNKPSVIFLDMNLPGTNGLACLRKLKKTAVFNDVPIYMYSGGTVTKREVLIALQEGARKWIRKPEKLEDYEEIFSIVFN
jgi:DNA-binding response OmpR family regulator